MKKSLNHFQARVKIKKLGKYFQITRDIKVGMEFDVVAISHNDMGAQKDKTGYLILIPRKGKPNDYLSMLEDEIELITADDNRTPR